MGSIVKRSSQIAVAVLFGLTVLMAGAADAHISSNYGGTHSFSKTATGVWASADDNVSDGHCTYAAVWDGQAWREGPRSCGSKQWKWHDTLDNTSIGLGYGCITGHWQCKFKANWV